VSKVSTSKALYASLSIVCAGVAEQISCTGGPKISAPRAAGSPIRVRFEGVKHRLGCIYESDCFIAPMHSLHRVASFCHSSFPLNHNISPAILEQSRMASSGSKLVGMRWNHTTTGASAAWARPMWTRAAPVMPPASACLDSSAAGSSCPQPSPPAHDECEQRQTCRYCRCCRYCRSSFPNSFADTEYYSSKSMQESTWGGGGRLSVTPAVRGGSTVLNPA
jgi:hypothetical protein